MTNLEVANLEKKEEFFANYNRIKSAKTEKFAINTNNICIDEHVIRFSNNTFSDEDEQALYDDAISV